MNATSREFDCVSFPTRISFSRSDSFDLQKILWRIYADFAGSVSTSKLIVTNHFTWAISIHLVMILARNWWDLGSVVPARIVLITRYETALNCSTVAATDDASELRARLPLLAPVAANAAVLVLSRSRRDQTAPRHWCGITRLNNS